MIGRERRKSMAIGADERERIVAQAMADLAGRLGIDRDEIEVRTVEETDFRDTSLGVSRPNEMYAQVITPGVVVRLAAGDEVYEYHGSGNRVVLAPGE
jgi:hypothetical protein